MLIIEPSFEMMQEINGMEMLRRLERIGRVCYKSEDKITDTSCEKFISNLLRRGHESVIEHEKITVKVICDRGVSHEIVRHRIASYSQESTRYCNYSQNKFGGQLTFIRPCFWTESDPGYEIWKTAMEAAEQAYLNLLESGASAQEARSVLPNSLKTELVMSMNLREWRHFFRLRTAPSAHPQIRQLAGMILEEFQRLVPVIFDDLTASES